ncbi:MAG: PQQ-like beta-propeller repeat protein [Gemmatimonadota bacterium]|nr:PQQ-like beta-propeller repeat protein [Gemmatimonadota bacterium]
MYFGTGDGRVIAREVNTGLTRWTTTAGNTRVEGYRLLARSGVVVVPISFETVGLDAQTGAVLWRYEAPRDTVNNRNNPGYVGATRPDADDATAYIPAWGASVSAVDLRTGAVRWVWQPGRIEGDTAVSGVFRSGSMGVSVSGDTVFATVWHFTTRTGLTADPWVVALDKTAGRELWRAQVPHAGSVVTIEAAPVIYQNLVMVRMLKGPVFAIDRATRQVAWQFDAGGQISTISGLELHGDTVYFDGGDQRIYALRARDGAVIWSSPILGQINRDILATERRITFTNGQSLFVLNRATGAPVANTKQPRTHDSFFASAATYSNGAIFVTVGDGAWAFEEP